MAGLTFLVEAITEKVVFEQNPEGLREQARWPAGKRHSRWNECKALECSVLQEQRGRDTERRACKKGERKGKGGQGAREARKARSRRPL